MDSVCVVVPVYNDWDSFRVLLGKLNAVARSLPVSMLVMGVDDGSTEAEWEPTESEKTSWDALDGVQIVQLAANLGHQRAIAVGMCVVLRGGAKEKAHRELHFQVFLSGV